MTSQPANDDTLRQELPEPPEDKYPFVATHEQGLRCFIFEMMADADIDGKILVENMNYVYEWINEGTVPVSASQPLKKLKSATG